MRSNSRSRRGYISARIRPALFASIVFAALLALAGVSFRDIPAAQAVSADLVISQVYGGAGCGTAGCSTYKNDYIEIFNRGSVAVSLTGKSVQYGSAAGNITQATALTGTLNPGQYYLVAQGAGANGVNNIPTADATGSIAMSATAGKVAIVNSTTPLGCGQTTATANPCNATQLGLIIDLVGYGSTTTLFEGSGPAPAPSTTNADFRAGAGCTDTDNNASDFTAAAANPRNTATALAPCGGGGGGVTLSVNDVSQDEGNAGTTAFTFTVTLSSATHGGVTFDIATADGTAQDDNPTTEDNDYQPNSATGVSIPNGTQSAQFTVQVNGDTTSEPNETFFVNVTNVVGATVADGQGQGTIVNDDITVTPIYQIQGSGTASPLATQTGITTTGVVTAKRSLGSSNNGFYIQDPAGDGNLNTSDAVLVFTGSTVPTVNVGDSVRVTGTVVEFESSTTDEPDGVSPPDPKTTTEITSPTITVLSTGNTPPAALDATTLNILDPTATSRGAQLEKYEHMRVSVPSLVVSQPTNGFGEFWGHEPQRTRPFREPGIERGDPVPVADQGPHAGATPPNVPVWDGNFERIMVDSGAALTTGSTRRAQVQVTTGTTVTGVVGPLDYAFDQYRIVLESNVTPGVSGGLTAAVPVSPRAAQEFTVAHTNLQNFVSSNATKMNKASLAIRNVLRTPDILGLIEVDTAASATALANKVNADAADPANVNYVAYFGETSFTQDIGYLVNTARVTVVGTPTQYNPTATFNYCGVNDTLHDRPAFILTAAVPQPGAGTLPLTVILNHTKSLIAVDSPRSFGTCGTGTEGARNREKRRLQAEDIADLIQTRENAGENLVVLGDLNAYEFNDGLVDVVNTIRGVPPPADQVVEPSTDRWTYQLTNLLTKVTPDQQYSYVFEGNAQAIDHVLVNSRLLARNTRFAYGRFNADFSDSFAADSTRPERVSDHDAPVAYFTLTNAAQAGQLLISEFRHFGPNGAFDEFVEIYNNTDSEHLVVAGDGSAGYSIATAADQTAGTPRCVIPNSTRIPARGYFLCVNTAGYSLVTHPSGTSRDATGDATYTLDIPFNAGIALFATANTANYNTNTRLDAVGSASEANALYKETNGYPDLSASAQLEYSFFRDLRSGTPKDTNDNAADFLYVNTAGTDDGAGGRLGAPGPQNLSSPVQRNGFIKSSLIDPSCSGVGTATASSVPGQSPDGTPGNNTCQNTVRDTFPLTMTQPDTSANGSFFIRRRFRNNTGQNVTRLRFRVVDTVATPQTGTADLRLLTSGAVTYTVNSAPVTVQGLILEEPPAQPKGGAFNSSVQCCTAAPGVAGSRTISLATPLAPNDTIDVQFRFGVMAAGAYRFFVNVEAELEQSPAQNSPSKMGTQKTKH